MDLADVLDDLYGSAPTGFTAARDAFARQARAEGDRELAGRIGALRRPLVPAWAVNLLVRERGEDVERLLELGAAMREATASLAGAELRELRVRQHEVLEAVRVQVVRLAREAGVRLSPGAGERVVATLRAAMADAAAADAVRSGLLVRPLEPAGFGEVDLAGATASDAAPPRPPAASPRRPAVPRDELSARREVRAARDAERQRVETERRERERAELHEAVRAARTELDDARGESSSAAAELSSARRRYDDLVRRRDDLQARLDAVAAQLAPAAGALRAAERAAHAAQERVAAAERELERLRARLPD
ncbi:hypothetical protein [Kineococcus aurantiacus]|uniref:ElaB/YqjD/DUF883 family membrane-anchored ribosome-binding protein n=1 Tax=Kineococcus aurantiacus TaxID=37633 RepID=A0A7Y9ASL1_9ACTN|nr:hypothetical protein [Kineococcus aurantiacus]NYD21228.1 ElaB/YqjD/DUF883 family membrane-anchored ribosome-binding protein [Kineococcus aurantiacus]